MKDLTTVVTGRSVVNENYSNELVFWLNGEQVTIDNPDPSVLLADYLHNIGLFGTKTGCQQGGCGACTVMVSHREPDTGKETHRPINSCLRPLCAVDGMMVTTTEGIGNVADGLDPTQYCIAKNNGTQCGFCTPGFVMNLHAFLQEHPKATQQEIEDIFGGNLCRCTGYRPILHGTRTLACDYDAECYPTQQCIVDPSFEVKVKDQLTRINLDQLPSYKLPPRQLYFSGEREWYRPNTLEEVYRLKKELSDHFGAPNVRLVSGNTATGIYPKERPHHLIDISMIRELHVIQEKPNGVEVGANVCIQTLIEFADELSKRLPEEQTRGMRELKRHGTAIAGLQVRSAGSVAGNIFITRDHALHGAPFPSDLYTVLSGLGTKVTIGSKITEGYPKEFLLIEMPAPSALPVDAVILSFHIPFTRSKEFVQTHRVARRPQMAHPIVNAGFRVLLDENDCIVPGECTMIFGGLASMIYRADKTAQLLHGKPINNDTLQSIMPALAKEIEECTIPMDEEGITTEYRRQLGMSFFYKFFLHLATKVDASKLDHVLLSAAEHDIRELSSGLQEATEYPELYPLSQPIIKRAAFVQASGEIRYTQDVALPLGGFHAVMVKSIRPHARFSFTKNVAGLDALKELLKKQFPGFKDLVTANDVPPGGSHMGGLCGDDPVFSKDVVTSVGAPIALALADTIPTAKAAAVFVEEQCIAYEDLPAVITLEDAVKANTEMPMIRLSADPDEDIVQRIPSFTRDGSNQAWLENPKVPMPGTEVAFGKLRTPAQAHFYLETNCALAIPGPHQQMTIYSSTQSPNGTQVNVAKALGVKANQITVLVEQIGGGFGGKQHRANIVAAQAAVAANKMKKPVRLLYDRETDMQMIGKRHPYEADYHVAFTKEGKIKGIRIDIKSDAGDTYDCTFPVLDLSLMQSDGCYNVETMQANGKAYRTNKTSNTAFRTFGVVQAWTILETIIERVAFELTKSTGRKVRAEEIRLKNLYRDGTAEEYDVTHFGQELDYFNIREMWDELYKSSDFERREKEVAEFNAKNRWRKRGIAMVPQKHGIAFTEPRGSLNSATAMVVVNMGDGSVVIYHGGVEMGQGVNTKIAQLAANTLGIPLELIRIGGNNTDAIVNCPATAASTGYDLNGGAVEKACRTLRQRLENFCRDMEQYTPQNRIEHWRTKWPEKWGEIVFKAWFQRVNLSAIELYKTPHYKGPSERNPNGKPFLYFSLGAAVTEVEIDVLTGDFKIVRADAVCDVCKSPNTAIDIGQLEGGFVQGIGYSTTEECVYDHDGRLVTDNIWSYKPPCTKTIPVHFRTRLHPVDEKRNAREELAEMQAVKSSKSFTESALTLGATTYFALIHAIKAARIENTGINEWVDMDLPLTCQKIQTLCAVNSKDLAF